MPLGMEVGLRPGDVVLDGDPAPSKGWCPPSIFGPCLLWLNGWMHHDGTWHGGRRWSRPHCARRGPSFHPQKRAEPPIFGPFLGDHLYKSSPVAEMGDRGHNRHGPKDGALLCPFRAELGPRLIQCGLGRGLLPCQVASSSIQLFGHNKHGPKIGELCPLLGRGTGSPITPI